MTMMIMLGVIECPHNDNDDDDDDINNDYDNDNDNYNDNGVDDYLLPEEGEEKLHDGADCVLQQLRLLQEGEGEGVSELRQQGKVDGQQELLVLLRHPQQIWKYPVIRSQGPSV